MGLSRLRLFRRSTDGIVAVEFAFVVPVMISVFFGGYAVTQTVSISRKVSITTRALADLTTQYATMSSIDMATVLNASTQVLAPFDATPLSMRLSEITTDVTGLLATVTWSCARGTFSKYPTGSSFTLPLSMLKANTSYVYSETSYLYTPAPAISTGAITVADHIYMLPRLTTAVSYTGGSTC